jgi:hypothetical protein
MHYIIYYYNLTPAISIEVPVASQGSGRLCMYVRGINFVSVSTIFKNHILEPSSCHKERWFLQALLQNKNRKSGQTFNSSFRYIDDVLSLNNSRFGNYLHLIYPNKLEVKDTADTQKSASTKCVGGAYNKKCQLIWTTYLWNCMAHDHRDLKVTYLRNLNFRSNFWKINDTQFHSYFWSKILTGMVISVPPYETFSLIKNNILHQSKNYKNHFENSNFFFYIYL